MAHTSRALRALACGLAAAAIVSGCGLPLRAPKGEQPTPEAQDRASARCAHPARSADLEPDSGAWLGVSLDWAHDSLAEFSQHLGAPPAVAVTFAGLPFSDADKANVDAAVEQARGVRSMLLLTLEPHDGLKAVTDRAVHELVDRIDRYNRTGVPVFVRFAHEMNGSWYRWGQDPAAFVATFRRVANAVHAGAPGSAVVWAPNYGGGYPFAGGRFEAKPGTRVARSLDTNRDGDLTAADDPYAPYWPGRQYVDWVGMSLYHWGSAYPWGENEVPEPGKFTDLLRGRYDGAAGDERGVPDFYARYARRLGLPLAITETAAFYAPRARGAEELELKSAWWRQVFADANATSLPLLKMVNWFEWDKRESEVRARVDWTVTRGERTREAFRSALPDWVRFADDSPTCR